MSTFANSDAYGSSGISQFQTSAVNLGVQILSSSLFPVGQTNFATPIAEALKTRSRIFVFFMAAQDMGLLLAQGYAAGLFSEGTQIIASDAGMSATVWATMPTNEVARMMKGVLAFIPSPDYTSPQAAKFLKAFISQANTVKNPITGQCDNSTDDSGTPGTYLFKRALNANEPYDYTCSGTNFTRMKADGSNVDNYVSYAYDATYAVARAMHVELYLNKAPKITGKGLYSALINNISFVGVTGFVNFSRAITQDSSRFGEGDRRTGVRYKIMNFNSKIYNDDPSHKSGFIGVGIWTAEGGNRITSAISYNTVNNSPPTYQLPTIFLIIDETSVRTLVTLSMLLFVLSTIITTTIIANKNTKLVRSMQVRMQLFTMVGAFLGSARVLTGSYEISVKNCSLNLWLSHLSFWFLFTPMMLKIWRVHRIINNKTLKRLTITESCIANKFYCIISFVILYLAIMQNITSAKPISVAVETHTENRLQSYQQCGARNMGKFS